MEVYYIAEHLHQRDETVQFLRTLTETAHVLNATATFVDVSGDVADVLVGSVHLHLHHGFHQHRRHLVVSILKTLSSTELEGHITGIHGVISTIHQHATHIHHGIACQRTLLHSGTQTLLDGGDVLARHHAALAHVHKLETLAGIRLETDEWRALRIPGARLSAAQMRAKPLLCFTEIPDYYRDAVKRYFRRLVIKRSWSYCSEMLRYIRVFFALFYRNGYGDGFLKNLSRFDIERYLEWVSEEYRSVFRTV